MTTEEEETVVIAINEEDNEQINKADFTDLVGNDDEYDGRILLELRTEVQVNYNRLRSLLKQE